jgi:hypothetical protein
LGGGRDVTAPPKFAAYGYDEAAGTWESPEPHPDITATNWIWSDQDKVKRWDRTAFFVDRTLQFIAAHTDQPCFVNVWLDDPHTPWLPEAVPAGEEKPKPQSPENLKKVFERARPANRPSGMKASAGEYLAAVHFGQRPAADIPGQARHRTTRQQAEPVRRWRPRSVHCSLAERTCRPERSMRQTVIAGVDLAAHAGRRLRSQAARRLSSRMVKTSAVKLLGQNQQRARSRSAGNTAVTKRALLNIPTGNDRSPQLATRAGKWKLLVNADGSQLELYDLAADSQRTDATSRRSACQSLTACATSYSPGSVRCRNELLLIEVSHVCKCLC